MPSTTFHVTGLDCAEEVAILRREVGPLVGGESQLAFDLLRNRLIILAALTAEQSFAIERAIARTGMSATLLLSTAPPSPQRNYRLHTTALSLALLLAGLAVDPTQHHPAARFLFTGATIAGAAYVLPRAWFALRSLRPDMNLLMVIAITGALAIGEWLEAATVAFLFAVSLLLESLSVARARHAIEKLLDLSPVTVRIAGPRDSWIETPVESVAASTRFLVRPGERIALDGVILSGSSEINQAPITGESLPVSVAPGSTVFAGTINGSGSLEVRATCSSTDTTLAHIIRLVAAAQQHRAPSEQWVDRFARRYTPAVMALAIGIALVPLLVPGAPYTLWLYRALVLLVIACPCALVLSTPVSVVSALTAAAANGVLVKGGSFMEIPARLSAIAFDKTGTLTLGQPVVTAVVPLGATSATTLLECAAAIESHSDHPLARAILAHANASGLAPTGATGFTLTPGLGATALWRGVTWTIGSPRFISAQHAVPAEIAALESTGHTAVLLADAARLHGYIVLADAVRPTAAATLAALRSLGIPNLVMLTGDSSGAAQSIASRLGLTQVFASLLPADKLAAISTLVSRHGSVAMVGDGINDAPALSRATIGIAMGAAGSDAALEAADIALMSDDLSRLPWLITHSRRMLAIIRFNIALSLGVKAVFAILALAGYSTLWGAILADMGVSLIVIMNALRLLR
jgi:Zn2+/Cd2+-exporting ATPase